MRKIALLVAILLIAPSILMGEMIVVTKPMPDRNGEVWQREYSNINQLMFSIPPGVRLILRNDTIPIRPVATQRIGTTSGGVGVEDAWVNIVDLEQNRYYDGKLGAWGELDSASLISLRPGFDTCAVYFRVCDRPGAPVDSCKSVRVSLHDSLKVSDIAQIVFTSFSADRTADPKVFAKSGNYYRKLLGYFVREVPLSSVLDVPQQTSVVVPVSCNCLATVATKAILKVVRSPK
jgi:hypothetical protein